MSDLISRQAVLNSPVTMVSEGLDWIPAYHIKDLPSAEPEVIRCKNCKYYYNVLYKGTQFEHGECCRTFTEDVKPDDYCSRGEKDETN